MDIRFPYEEASIAAATVDDARLMGVFGPSSPAAPDADVEGLVSQALTELIDSPPLADLVRPDSRVAILDRSGEKLWDTGEIPTNGKMTFDGMNFIVTNREGAAVKWDAERAALSLRDVAEDPGSVLSVYVDNLRVTGFKAKNLTMR